MTGNPVIPEIKLANVVPGVTAVDSSEKGVNETFVGLIQTASDQLRAYIKVLDPRQLVNELICSTLGRAVGLPVPEGFIVRTNASDLPESGILAKHGGEALIFACADVGRPSLKRRLTESGAEFLASLFATWKQWDAATIFDEWVANPDRHAGNLLIEGPDKVWLIDHSHALTGPEWTAADLVPERAVRNQIAENCFPRLTLPERMAVRSKAGELSGVFGLVLPESALTACHAAQLLSPDDLEAVRKFVGERVGKLFDLVSSRLGIPNMGV
jgi:hypothetical protein